VGNFRLTLENVSPERYKAVFRGVSTLTDPGRCSNLSKMAQEPVSSRKQWFFLIFGLIFSIFYIFACQTMLYLLDT
jgi:hypothetical protein